MTVQDLEVLYSYGYWANRKLFDVIAQLERDEFTGPVGGSYGSIRDTLVHSLSAEWGWLDRCGGPERGARLTPAHYPDLDSLRVTWSKVEGYVREFLSNLEDGELARDVTFTVGEGERSMPLGELLQHAANHGVHHRGQVALLLRLLGQTPGNFDLLFYFAERRSNGSS